MFCAQIHECFLCTHTRMHIHVCFVHTYTNIFIHIHVLLYTYTRMFCIQCMHFCKHATIKLLLLEKVLSVHIVLKTKLLQLVTNIFSPSIYKSSFLMKILELKRLVSSHTKHDQVRHIMVLQKAKAGVCICTCIIEITIPQQVIITWQGITSTFLF
jgi:hypothetical protein